MNMLQQIKILGEAAVGLEDSVKADVEFNNVIARASKNSYYAKLIDFLGVRLVPHRSLYLRQGQAYIGDSYKAVIRTKHEAVVDAINLPDPDAARVSERTLLLGRIQRHTALPQHLSPHA